MTARVCVAAAMSTDYVIPPPPTPSAAIHGTSERFALRRVLCVGRNYAAHAREMGQDPERDPPFFFAKPADSVFDAHPSLGASIVYPPLTENLHHEIELAVAIGIAGRDIPPGQALDHVFGYAPALDLTRRDLQKAAKAKGHPWEFGKAFDRSAPLGAIVPAAQIGHPTRGRVWLEVNGDVRQEGDLSELIWSVAEVIAELSASIALAPGDLILTGTPAGVGPLNPGDTVRAGVEGVGALALGVARD